jgi:P-type Cu+ transporter
MNDNQLDTTAASRKPSHIDLRIGGMTCPHCPPTVEKAIAAVRGVISAHINLTSNIASITYDPSRTKVGDVLQAAR